MSESQPIIDPEKSKIEIAKEKFGSLGNESGLYHDILEARRDKILAHEYSCVVGDDKSARVPGFVIGNAINEIYQANGQERVPVLFINPINMRVAYVKEGLSKEPRNDERIKSFNHMVEKAVDLVKKAEIKDGTMLFVTDFIASGETVKIFKQIAEKSGLKIDVASYWDWHWKHGDYMVNSDDKESIHSEPLWINVEDEEDFKKQIERLIKRKTAGGQIGWWMLAHGAKQNIIENVPEFGDKDEEGALEYLFKLPLADKLKLLEFFREAGPYKSRKKAMAFSKHLADGFISEGD